ncbi:Hypothetical protein FKW44_010555 [Caligus rogercresseyi]|uniref:Uncharacterized protein n=1 Tax=Caligus rogercresseyi TaxID=217165 RepID=A0A7T8HGW2_CALRO|nr:Hypothetical protein FKW44_010555 [Caligus rogercresseyi]
MTAWVRYNSAPPIQRRDAARRFSAGRSAPSIQHVPDSAPAIQSRPIQHQPLQRRLQDSFNDGFKKFRLFSQKIMFL